MIEVGTVVRCVPGRPKGLTKALRRAGLRKWKGPKPPWTDCPVEFGDVGVVEKLDDSVGDSPMKLVKFFRWPDEEIWLSDMWLEVVDE